MEDIAARPDVSATASELKTINGIDEPQTDLWARHPLIVDVKNAERLQFDTPFPRSFVEELEETLRRSVELEWLAAQDGKLGRLSEVYKKPASKERPGQLQHDVLDKGIRADPSNRPEVIDLDGWAVGECALVTDIEIWHWQQVVAEEPRRYPRSIYERYYLGLFDGKWYIYAIDMKPLGPEPTKQ